MNGRCRRKLPPGLIQEDNRQRARNGRRRGASPREVCDSRDSSVRIKSQVIGRLFDDHAFVTFAASALGGTSDSAASGRVYNYKDRSIDVLGKSVSVRLHIGGSRSIKKKTKK